MASDTSDRATSGIPESTGAPGTPGADAVRGPADAPAHETAPGPVTAPGSDAAAGPDTARAPDARPEPEQGAVEDPLALANQLCFSLSVASRTVVQSYRPVLEPLGLTHPQYLVMLALWGSAPRTVKDLAEQLNQDSATISPLLKRLEARGYVTRERDPHNERALAVALTPEGTALRERAREVPLRMMQRLNIGPDQMHALNEQMHRLITSARDLGDA